MIVNLLDPGLIHTAGHHLEWDRLIAAELSAQGHQVTVYGHIGITPEVRAAIQEPVKLVPLFRNQSYLDPLELDPLAGELMGFIDVAAALAQDLGSTANADLWLWPSLFPVQLYACSLVRPEAPVAGCIQLDPGYRSSVGGAYWRYAFIKANQAGLRMNLGTTGPILQEEYSALFGNHQPVQLLPVPVFGYPGNAPRTRLKTIGFFGHQRQEKGSRLVPPLVSMLLQEGYQVVLHDSGDALGSRQVPGLTRIGYVPDLAAEIAKCDLAVVPYAADSYRSRESAIVWDALASGVPVVVPHGTAPGLRVLTNGAGKVFHFPTAWSVHRAIVEAKMDYEQIATAAFRTSQKWSQTQGTGRLVQALVKDVIR